MAEADNTEQEHKTPAIQIWIAILWPSFLVAGLETIVFFTLFDPNFVFAEYEISRTGAYSIGFFLFWIFSILPLMLAMFLAQPCKPSVEQDDPTQSNDNSSGNE